jgi:hypothetical protein
VPPKKQNKTKNQKRKEKAGRISTQGLGQEGALRGLLSVHKALTLIRVPFK